MADQSALSDSDVMEEVKNMLNEAFKKRGMNSSRPIFGMLAGSCAFNLAVQSSDKDYFGIYLSDIDTILSLQPPPDSIDQHEPDLIMYEAEKYLRLLAKGNPKVIEPLYCEHLCFQSEEWKELKKLRHNALTQVTVKQYVSYALGKVSELKNGKGTVNKNYYHAIRLLREAKRMANGDSPKVWMEGEERDYLMSIRKGGHSAETLLAEVDRMHKEVEGVPNQLPKEIDLHVMDKWLVAQRMKQVKSVPKMVPVNNQGNFIRSKAEELLTKYGLEGEILCCIPSGSRLYGTNVDESGKDYVGIYVAPIEKVVSLFPSPQRIDEEGIDSKQKIVFTKGLTLFELKHACELIAGGNFRFMEALFFDNKEKKIQEDEIYETQSWAELKGMRNNLLSQQFAIQCGGVVEGKLKAFSKESPEEANKTLVHAVRLLSEAIRVLEGKEPSVVLDKEERDYILGIRKKEFSVEEIMKVIDSKKQLLESLKKTSTVSKKSDKDSISNWMVKVRKDS